MPGASAISSRVARPSVSRGVHVQVAANVCQLHQLGQAAFGGRLDFARVFAQFRRNPSKPERLVDLLFGFAGTRAFVIQREQPVFIQRKPIFRALLRRDDVMFLAAGEILHGGAETFCAASARTSTCRPSRPNSDAGFVRTLAQHFVHARMRDESVERLGRGAGPGDQKVEIADRLLAASQAARRRHFLDARQLCKYVVNSVASRWRSSAGNGPALCRYSSIDRSTFSSSFAPMRGRSRSFCSRQIRSRSSIVLNAGDVRKAARCSSVPALNLQQLQCGRLDILRASRRAGRTIPA